jgi:carbon storage regulator CsrA
MWLAKKSSGLKTKSNGTQTKGIKMLVLTRREGERIVIGEGIEIVIVKTKGGAVKIGIEAPAEVKVLRSELADK